MPHIAVSTGENPGVSESGSDLFCPVQQLESGCEELIAGRFPLYSLSHGEKCGTDFQEFWPFVSVYDFSGDAGQGDHIRGSLTGVRQVSGMGQDIAQSRRDIFRRTGFGRKKKQIHQQC